MRPENCWITPDMVNCSPGNFFIYITTDAVKLTPPPETVISPLCALILHNNWARMSKNQLLSQRNQFPKYQEVRHTTSAICSEEQKTITDEKNSVNTTGVIQLKRELACWKKTNVYFYISRKRSILKLKIVVMIHFYSSIVNVLSFKLKSTYQIFTKHFTLISKKNVWKYTLLNAVDEIQVYWFSSTDFHFSKMLCTVIKCSRKQFYCPYEAIIYPLRAIISYY